VRTRQNLAWRAAKTVVAALALCVQTPGVEAAEIDARGSQVLGWQTADIARVLSFTPYGPAGIVADVEGRKCLRGYQFHFDVLDNLAFDIDETVDLDVTFDLQTSARQFRVEYDVNSGAPVTRTLDLPATTSGRFHVERIRLPRARLAGRLDFATDFRIAAHAEGADRPGSIKPETTICDIGLARTFGTAQPTAFGLLNLETLDERGRRTPVRVSIVDGSGRMPLPESAAVVVKDFSNRSRSVLLPTGAVNWPSQNRWAYYIDGRYGARLPIGVYTLTATKGIEYRFASRQFEIKPDATTNLSMRLERWTDMPARGWQSGDVHTHFPRRDLAENHALWLQTSAEDLHIANTLRMGNIAATYFPQSFWGSAGVYGKDGYFLVAGQEDPRTAVRGHTVHLDLAGAVRHADRYLSYHEVFAGVHEQGGISGYAHLDRLGARVGMALDVPFGNVRFIEVLQRGELTTDVWFEFLNLGYRIAPAAGSDAPYGARIGDVRTYARSQDRSGPQGWFAGLARGATFVTNGPIIEFELNGSGVGEVVASTPGERLHLKARVAINPDIDRIERIELIEQGQVVEQVRPGEGDGATSVELAFVATARTGTWFVVRVLGARQRQGAGSVAAITAPIYVSIGGGRTWKRAEVAALAQKMKDEIDQLAKQTLGDAGRLDEWFETAGPWTRNWDREQEQLRRHMVLAKSRYDELLETVQRER
jgi:hypothetical protein